MYENLSSNTGGQPTKVYEKPYRNIFHKLIEKP